ncbi:MAG: hypothetical protein JWN00_2687, partial [Actinomycetia bacterium]|nr:hypothetical protein [Actinomycetes bacterium]
YRPQAEGSADLADAVCAIAFHGLRTSR